MTEPRRTLDDHTRAGQEFGPYQRFPALTFAGTSFGQYGAQADVGRTFGDRDEFGLRTNLSATHVEKGISGASGQRYFGSLAGDCGDSPHHV